MRLGEFILARLEPILVDWEAFAATLLPAAAHLDTEALRDHAKMMLEAIAKDLSVEQSDSAQLLKSQGLAPRDEGAPQSAARTHGALRARDGFDINQMTAEYRALRATVMRLWLAESGPSPDDLHDVIRFNEAIDQALSESICDFSLALEKSRNLLLGMLGHDMRTPLSVIVTTASHLTRLNAGEEVSSAAGRLIRSGARIQALVSDLVDFSRTRLGVGLIVAPARIDLAKIFREELDLQRTANPGRVITLEVSGNVEGAWDGNRIHQVLGNLVSNALKYGSVDTPINIQLSGDAAGVSFSVANDGAAIPAQFIAEIFEPLSRGPQTGTDVADAGLGLGLYISRAIVHAHKGAISVRSDEKETVVCVDLPR